MINNTVSAVIIKGIVLLKSFYYNYNYNNKLFKLCWRF